jgi:predicted nucleic acid-binding protein
VASVTLPTASASVLGRGTVLWSEDLNDGQEINGVTIRDPFRGSTGT